MTRLDEIAQGVEAAALDGWLFYDFRLSDPLAYRILGLPSGGIATRRWFCFVPAAGRPRAIVSAVEAHRLEDMTEIRDMIRESNIDRKAEFAELRRNLSVSWADRPRGTAGPL